MNSKTLIGIGAAILIAGLVFLGLRSEKALVADLPPLTYATTKNEAYAAALAYALQHGGQVYGVAGTGSMSPFIPRAKIGQPVMDVVAFVVTDQSITYDRLTPGKLCLYAHESNPDKLWLHLAASIDGDGWIMTGLANRNYENWMRVTAANFRGAVAHVVVIQQ